MESEGFCRDSFWNQSMVWNTTRPQFTHCFEDTVLVGLPSIFLWFLTPFWLSNIYGRRRRTQYPSPTGKFATICGKFICLVILMGSTIFKLIHRSETLEKLYPSDMVGLSLLFISYAFIAVLIVIERKSCIHTSPLQFYFWLLHFFTFIPQFVKDIQELALANANFEAVTAITAITGLPILLINVVLHCVSDHHQSQNSPKSPESTSSHFSYLFFSWMDNLIFKG